MSGDDAFPEVDPVVETENVQAETEPEAQQAEEFPEVDPSVVEAEKVQAEKEAEAQQAEEDAKEAEDLTGDGTGADHVEGKCPTV
jgi:hypothetical protein